MMCQKLAELFTASNVANSRPIHNGRVARVLEAQQPYKLPVGSACADGIETPSLR